MATESDDDPLFKQTGLTPAERISRAITATNIGWAMCEDRAARMEVPQKKSPANPEYFFDAVDRERVLLPGERLRRAENMRKAYFARLALKSSKARRLRKAQRLRDQAVELEREVAADSGGGAA